MDATECPKCGAQRAAGATICPFCKAPYLTSVSANEADAEGDGFEEGWAWCLKCSALFFDVEGGAPCPAGGQHDASESDDYALATDPEFDGEEGWLWCKKCQCVFAGEEGVCAADHQGHDGSESEEYRMSTDPDLDGQDGWKWCADCGVLFFWEGEGPAGVCPAGGEHDTTGEDEYTVVVVEDAEVA